MKYTNDSALDYLNKRSLLLDAKIHSFQIREGIEKSLPELEILFSSYRVQGSIFTLRFLGVQEFGFYWRKDYFFYNSNRVKFFKTSDGNFYFSGDPVDENEAPSPDDQDFVLATGLEFQNPVSEIPDTT